MQLPACICDRLSGPIEMEWAIGLSHDEVKLNGDWTFVEDEVQVLARASLARISVLVGSVLRDKDDGTKALSTALLSALVLELGG